MMRSFKTIALALAGILWFATVAVAYRAIRKFETTPGRAAASVSVWPSASTVPRTAGHWTLIMLLHPQCSCSRASVSELSEIVQHSPASLQVFVLVYKPREFSNGWEQTEVWRASTRIPQARVIIDPDGRESKLFGGFTSGQTFLYDGHGSLRYTGGVTLLRGHAGANRGTAEIIRIVNTGSGTATHPVFGCAIGTS